MLNWVVTTLKAEVHPKFRTVYSVYKKLVHINDPYTLMRLEFIDQIVKVVSE
jgi:hypothetical protein